jgi:peptidase M23-like protein
MSKYNYPGYKPTSDGFLTARPKSRGGYHGGTDNAAAPGTPVYAQYGGKVFRSGPINGYGMAVIVKSEAPDGTRFYQLYGHLGPGPLPPPGTPVTADQPIPGAVIGTTEYVRSIAQGITQGPHVHREIISENATLNESDRLGTDSSDLTYKADPDTFDINHPVFPYEPPHGAPLPPRQPQQGNGETRLTAPPPAHSDPAEASSPELSPGMAIPGAEDPTVVGGPDAQYPLVPPARTRSRAPSQGNSWLDTPGSDFSRPPPGDGPTSSNVRATVLSLPAARFPVQGLLAPDGGRVLDRWASSSPRGSVAPQSEDLPGGLLGMMIRAGVIDPSNPDQPAPGGLPGLILQSMRENQNSIAGG